MKRLIQRLPAITWAAAVICVLMPAQAAHAQGCVLCYTSLAAAGSSAMHAFQMAMLVLLVPALLLFSGILVFILRRGAAADAAQLIEAPEAAKA